MINFEYHWEQKHLVVRAYMPYLCSSRVEIRRRGLTNKWNVFLRVNEGREKRTGNLFDRLVIVDNDPEAAMLKAIEHAKDYYRSKLTELESL